MSGRKLGGGRILGSGRSLSPAAAIKPQTNSRLLSSLSPSTSSVSLDSSTSAEPQDLSSRISLDQIDGASAMAATASARLACPICNEEMVTLLQLNRHLDDDHKNLEEVKQDEVKDWFKTQMIKAKKFQPLVVLNQKLKGLEVFESNDAPRDPDIPPSASPTPLRSPEPPRQDPDEVVTRTHWQKPGANDSCAEPMCGKRLNATSGKVNCRKCGKLFCEDHTMYQMKLSRSAQHEPVRGVWCRICETCYKSREGYIDHNGLEQDHTKDFAEIRRKRVDKTFLEVSRLEKRLTRLTQLLAHPLEHQTTTGSMLWPLSPMRNQRKELEQSVVTWEDDAAVPRCPFCQQEFSNYTFRRRHCRTCGRVVCGDPRTDCSSEIGLNVATATNGTTKQATDDIRVDVRMCKDCQHTVFSKRDFAFEIAQKPPDVRAYENLVQFERGIRLLLPKFQRLLVTLQDPDESPSPSQLADAGKIRKRLVDSFAQYDVAARKIRDLPSLSKTQKKLQKAIYQQATNFLHLHMLPLKTLPKLLKHALPHDAAPNGHLTPNGRPQGALVAIKYSDIDSVSQVSSSSVVSALEEEEKALRDRLIVLEEQKFFVSEMIADANKRRKFDEVSSLAQNVQDLSKEIDQIQGQLEQLDFAGAYSSQATDGTLGS